MANTFFGSPGNLFFQLQQKCKHQKGNLSQPLKMSQMLMDVKGKLMKKCHFWILQISSSLFSQFKNLIAMANNGCWNKMKKKFRYFTKEMTSPKFWPASPRCATGQLFYGPEVAAMHQPSFQHLPRCNQLLYVQEHDLYLERGGFRNLVLTWDFVRKG